MDKASYRVACPQLEKALKSEFFSQFHRLRLNVRPCTQVMPFLALIALKYDTFGPKSYVASQGDPQLTS